MSVVIETSSPILALQVFSEGRLHHILDGLDEDRSNWMRYVNPACRPEEQNLAACQTGMAIYFYTVQPVCPGQELLVWYCPEFAQRLNCLPPPIRLVTERVGKKNVCVWVYMFAWDVVVWIQSEQIQFHILKSNRHWVSSVWCLYYRGEPKQCNYLILFTVFYKS